MMKPKKMTAPPKRGTRTLNVKRGRKAPSQDTGKRPAPGERKAARKRVILTNDNALDVLSLKDLDKATMLNEANGGLVKGIPAQAVDALRAVDAFKTTQGWRFFRRPATLIRRETLELAKLLQDVESRKRTIRRILIGERWSGKSTVLLQGLAQAFLRDWVVVNLPDGTYILKYRIQTRSDLPAGQDLTNAHTEYAPLPESNPTQYTQDVYTANLLGQIVKANKAILEKYTVTTNPTLPIPLPTKAKLRHLAELGTANPEASWPVFVALWKELTLPGRPPIMFALDGASHIMKNSAYLSADVKPVHAYDLTLIRHFIDHLSGASKLPNGGMVLLATSESNKPSSPALDFSVSVAESRQRSPDSLPRYNPYKALDMRVMEALKDLHSLEPRVDGSNGINEMDIMRVGSLSKDEARSIMEYYAESGMIRAKIDDGFVGEKWSLAGMGNIGELERASVRLRI